MSASDPFVRSNSDPPQADLTPLRYRALVSALTSVPYFINFYAGSKIEVLIVTSSRLGWRWGYGLYCIVRSVTSSLIGSIDGRPVLRIRNWPHYRRAILGAEPREEGEPCLPR